MTIEFVTTSIIANWQKQTAQFEKVLDSLTNDQLKNDVAPGKNSGIYLLGHLVAVNEGMLTLLELGEKKYPELYKEFVQSPDKSGQPFYEPNALRALWKETTNELTNHFLKIESGDWFNKHSSVSTEDFEKDPTRNKLSIILSRTQHLAYHAGQMALLK